MSVNDDIRNRLKRIVHSDDEIFSIQAEVVSVDLEAMTCDCVPFNEGGDLLDVQLIPRDKDGVVKTGLVLVPKVGAIVFITMLNNSDGFVAMSPSEIETVLIGGDTYGGWVKIEDLVTKLNNAENKINDIISILKAIAIPLAPSGTYLFNTIPAIALAQALTPTQREDLENEFIKHGPGL